MIGTLIGIYASFILVNFSERIPERVVHAKGGGAHGLSKIKVMEIKSSLRFINFANIFNIEILLRDLLYQIKFIIK